ncbi:AraC family transcriptional regulator [Paenibacillus chondroitinus]|uniref:AraC family transcriptional regulator n=1 Tax=Paenibacillus chondroitinus TaxID=59842 RepID=A0ABU6DEB6_9BACL|nr:MULTISPECIES: AraC family transcriptional regulator [Paenibacillus]MCY9656465.1 AraC family transcriptional regulator [Paenibacillus anseongense]MEB4795288.1 AraC family transcriptional regulator [Paenibacillus chondroitinus]
MNFPEVDKQNIQNTIVTINELKLYNNSYISSLIQAIRENRNFSAHYNIKRAMSYIENNFKNNELSLQIVADHVNLSVGYLSHIFKQSVGISFSHYLIQYRMEIAKQLLSNPEYKAYEIPELVGYTDYPHFTKSFKKVYGLTPREYRNFLGFEKN